MVESSGVALNISRYRCIVAPLSTELMVLDRKTSCYEQLTEIYRSLHMYLCFNP